MKVTFNDVPRIELLKARRARCVCKFCGGKLHIRQIVFSNHEEPHNELYCPACEHLEYGVEQEIYDSARRYVQLNGLNMYPDMDDARVANRMTVAQAADMMTWICKHANVLTDDGFTARF